jgi:hypothetical protein
LLNGRRRVKPGSLTRNATLTNFQATSRNSSRTRPLKRCALAKKTQGPRNRSIPATDPVAIILPAPPATLPPYRGTPPRPRGFSRRLRDKKSLVCFLTLTPRNGAPVFGVFGNEMGASLKFEIRSTKSETDSKSACRKARNKRVRARRGAWRLGGERIYSCVHYQICVRMSSSFLDSAECFPARRGEELGDLVPGATAMLAELALPLPRAGLFLPLRGGCGERQGEWRGETAVLGDWRGDRCAGSWGWKRRGLIPRATPRGYDVARCAGWRGLGGWNRGVRWRIRHARSDHVVSAVRHRRFHFDFSRAR